MIDEVSSYECSEVRWGDLEPGLYVIGKGDRLWRLVETRDGEWLVDGTTEKAIWPAQDPDRMVPVARLLPADPVTLLRERLNASTIAFKRNDADEWVAAPWYEEKPGQESIETYRSHMTEMHGVKTPVELEYDQLDRYHTEHHTPGVAHRVKHTHPDRRRPL